MKINLFHSGNGEAILINAKNKNILIDGGLAGTYLEIKKKLEKIKNLDLVILTHYDDDHIYGLIKLFQDKKNNLKIKKLWANLENQLSEENLYKVGVQPSEVKRSGYANLYLQSLIPNHQEIWNKEPILKGKHLDFKNGLKIDVMLPTTTILSELSKDLKKELKEKANRCERFLRTRTTSNDYHKTIEELLAEKYDEDISIVNISSIVTLFTCDDKKYLFTGDCTSSHLKNELKELGYSSKNKLELELFKLPHHGSENNFDSSILDIINCKKFLVLTNGNSHGHPDKKTIVSILEKNKEKYETTIFYTNYDRLELIFKDKNLEKYNATFEETKEILF